MSTVANFGTVDTIDISLAAFSNLVRDLKNGGAPVQGTAVFSNLVHPGGHVTVASANVLLIDSASGFVNAADIAATLIASPITFAGTQTNTVSHYIIAYQDVGGNVRIADMDNVIGSATGTTVQAGGWLFVSSGGVASSGTVLGRQEVLSGGIERGLIVGDGGNNAVSSGGVTSGTTVSSGGIDVVVGGGVESGTTVSPGGQAFDYGSTVGATVASGGSLYVIGTATGTTVQAGGSLFVSSGGVASGTTVSSGGTEIVHSGGVESGTTVSVGSVEYVESGGTLNGAALSGGFIEILSGGTAGTSQINFSSAGGVLRLDDSQNFNGVISGFGVPGGIDLADITFATATLGYSGDTSSGVLTVGDGLHTATIHVLGQYIQANFKLSNDGAGNTMVTDPPVVELAGSPFLAPGHG